VLDAGERALKPKALKAVKAPVVIVQASADDVVWKQTNHWAAKRIPRGRYVEVAGAKHEVIMEADDLRARIADNFGDIHPDSYSLLFRLYGRDGVMGALEPRPDAGTHELGIVIEAVAPTQALADTICGFARSTMLHYGYPGRVSTAGNLAFPYSPSDLKAGEVYRFSVYHLLPVDDPVARFPVHYEQVQPTARREAYA